MYLYLNVVLSRAGWSGWAEWKSNELIFLIQEELIWAANWFVKNLPQFGFSVLILDQSSKLFGQRFTIVSPICTRNENKLIEKESAWNKIVKHILISYVELPHSNACCFDRLSYVFCTKNGILLPKLFWFTVRKKNSSNREELLKFEAEDQEFSKNLRSLEQFIQTVKGQNNIW